MPLAILAFVFGVLLFLMSAAALALESQSDIPGVWRLALLALAAMHAASGFLAIGGASAYAQGRGGAAAGSAAAATAATAIAALAAFHLAAQSHLALARGPAICIVLSTLALGTVGVALMVHYSATTQA